MRSVGSMRCRRVVAAAAVWAVLGTPAAFGGTKPAAEVMPRVEYHLRQIDELAQHFQGVLREPCPHFATSDAWDSYLDEEVDRVVLLVAHVEQAWVEAKQTGDDDVRRAAKAPRKRLDEARTLLDKFQQCADDNGATFSQMTIWQKIQREVPRRQTEIRQPE
jgi:hypothetical protein